MYVVCHLVKLKHFIPMTNHTVFENWNQIVSPKAIVSDYEQFFFKFYLHFWQELNFAYKIKRAREACTWKKSRNVLTYDAKTNRPSTKLVIPSTRDWHLVSFLIRKLIPAWLDVSSIFRTELHIFCATFSTKLFSTKIILRRSWERIDG